MKKIIFRFLPFWLFLAAFKFGGGLHYSLIAPLGARMLPLWIVGFISGAGTLIQLLLDIPSGHILDRFGYLRMLKITTFVFLLAGLTLAFFDFNLIIYLATVTISMLGWLFFSGVDAYVLSHAEQSNSGKFMSLRDTFCSLGIVLESAILGIMLAFDTKTMGWVVAAAMLFALILLFFAPKDIQKATAEKKIETQHHYIRRNYLHEVLRILKKLNPASSMLLLLALTSGIFYAIIWFIVPVVIANQINSGLLSLGLGVFDFAVVILGFILGNLADKGNKRTLVFFGLLIFSLSGMILGFNFNWLFLIFGFLATSGDEMASISLWSWLHALDREHAADGLLAGALSFSSDLGWTIGPVLAGILYTMIGPSWTIMTGSLLIFCTWVIYQFLGRHHRNELVIDVPSMPRRRKHFSR